MNGFNWAGALGGGGLGALGSVLSGIGAKREASRARRRIDRALEWASVQAKGMTQAIMKGAPYSALSKWVTGMFEEGVPDWLRQQAEDQLRAAQAARGLAYGATPALQESFELASMAEQARERMAPMMERVAMAPITIGQQALNFYLQQAGLGLPGTVGGGPQVSPMEILGSALAAGLKGGLGGGMALGAMTGPGMGYSPMQTLGLGSEMGLMGLGAGGGALGQYLAQTMQPNQYGLRPWETGYAGPANMRMTPTYMGGY